MKNVKLNYLYNIAYQGIVIATPLITIPHVSRTLGVNGIGKYGFASSICSYFILFASFGTAIYGQREISYVQNDKFQRSSVFWTIELLSCITTFIGVLGYIFFVLVSDLSETTIYWIMLLHIITIAFDITWFFKGTEEFGKIVFKDSVFRIAQVVCILLFVRSSSHLIRYTLILCLGNLLGNISIWSCIIKKIERPHISMDSVVRIIPGVFAVFLPTVATTVYTYVDKTMLGIITHGETQNGYYEQALKIIHTTTSFVTALGTVLIPRIGAYYKSNNKGKLQAYMYKSFKYVWMSGIFFLFWVLCISKDLVPWFFGNGYEPVIQVLWHMSAIPLFTGLNNTLGLQYLVSINRQNEYTFSIVIGIIINMLLNAYLIPIKGASGAAIASVISELGILVFLLHKTKAELDVAHIFAISRNYLFAGVTGYIFVQFLGGNSNLLICFSEKSLVFVTAYLSVLFLLRDELSFIIINTVSRIFH